MDTIFAAPLLKTSSATSGVLMRLEVMTGMLTSPINFLVTQVNAARGTEVAIVGMRASCQPMPVLIIVAPASSTALASRITSSKVDPFGTKSIIERR